MAEYIDREAIRNRLYDADAITMNGVAILNNFPAADVVEVKRGNWIEKRIALTWCEDDVDVFYTCSVCGAGSPSETFYCPNCGAKMDGGKDETK